MSNKNEEVILFKDKSFADLLEDIYNSVKKNRATVTAAIAEIRVMITKKDDVQYIGPIMTDLFEVSIKNDEHLVKLASVVQRLIAADSRSNPVNDNELLTEKEKEQLLSELKDIQNEIEEEQPLVSDEFGELLDKAGIN